MHPKQGKIYIMMEYRKEIDGLRAIAVLPVILFHAGFNIFKGGFVGVDIFFVISGYLITSIILVEKKAGVFSLAQFYERRARRILPALLFIMIVSIPFAWMWMWPVYMKEFSESLIAVSGFISNIFFWKQSDYFAIVAELKPFLHTWSLAVEEQYYLLFPIFLLLILKWEKKWIISILTLVTMISLIIAQWGSHNRPAFTFYFLATRCWELLIGALVAFYLINKTKNNNIKKMNQIGSLFGLFLIFYSICMFDKNTPFPSLFTLTPTLGAACVIVFADSQTIVGKFLSKKLFVGLGLISYSAYLWHQPLFAFARLRLDIANGTIIFFVLSVCSLLFAYFSWKYIEVPFRNRKRINRKFFVIYCCLLSMIVIATGLYGHFKNGVAMGGVFEKLSLEEKKLESYTRYDISRLYKTGICHLNPEQSYKDFSPECKSITNEKITLLIWGDSHAAALSSGFRAILPNVIQFTASSCPPIIDLFLNNKPNCKEINDFILREINDIKPNVVILHANWIKYGDLDLNSGVSMTINRIHNASPLSKIYIIGGVPQWPIDLPIFMLTRGITLDNKTYIHNPKFKELKEIDNNLRLATKNNKAIFLTILDKVCKNESCQSVAEYNGKIEPTVWDYGHLTEAGSISFAKLLLQQM